MATSQESHNQHNFRQQKPKQWTYDEPYQYPIPRGDEDPWETLLEPLLAKDKVQCDAWKDEVQNLLIFAGLFSAVVTSFVVDSAKNLQPDPNTVLLSHIAALISNTSNSTVANIHPEFQFSPSPSSYQINALWFASLILSLTTVLVGIVSLQWIREHQRYSGLTLREKFSVFCMRKEALEAWYVPHIFAGLPLLLQGALTLYLAGLIDYLLGFGQEVAIPGIIFISLSLFFLVVTTVLPTLQGLVILPTHLEKTLDLPTPCPYKSPQSHAFRRLVTMFKRSFLATSRLMSQITWSITRFRMFLNHLIRRGASQPRFVTTSREFPSVLTVWCKTNWIDFDRSWLRFRDSMFLNITDGKLLNEYYRPARPLYDAVKGIRSIAWGNKRNPSEPYLYAQYHCLHDISPPIIGKSLNMTSPQAYQNTYFQKLLILRTASELDQESLFLSHMLPQDSYFDSQLLAEENTLAILDIVDPYHGLSPTLSKHFAECNFRLLAAVYSKIGQLYQKIKSENPALLMISPFSLSGAIQNIKRSENETEFVQQWALSIDSFFSAIIHSNDSDSLELEYSFHAHPFFQQYFHEFVDPIYLSIDDDLDPKVLSVVVSTINGISVVLNESFPNPQWNFLFYAASYYAKLLTTHIFRPRHPNIVSAVSTFLEALRNYKAQLSEGVIFLEKWMEIPSFSDKNWWGFLKEKPSFGYGFESKESDNKQSALPDSRKSEPGYDAEGNIPIFSIQYDSPVDSS